MEEAILYGTLSRYSRYSGILYVAVIFGQKRKFFGILLWPLRLGLGKAYSVDHSTNNLEDLIIMFAYLSKVEWNDSEFFQGLKIR